MLHHIKHVYVPLHDKIYVCGINSGRTRIVKWYTMCGVFMNISRVQCVVTRGGKTGGYPWGGGRQTHGQQANYSSFLYFLLVTREQINQIKFWLTAGIWTFSRIKLQCLVGALGVNIR